MILVKRDELRSQKGTITTESMGNIAKIGNKLFIAVRGGVVITEIDYQPPVKPKYRRFIANSWYNDVDIKNL